MIEDQAGFSVRMARFAYLCGIPFAHPKDSLFQFPWRLCAKFLVSSHQDGCQHRQQEQQQKQQQQQQQQQ